MKLISIKALSVLQNVAPKIEYKGDSEIKFERWERYNGLGLILSH